MNVSKLKKKYKSQILYKNICLIAVAVTAVGAIAISAITIPKFSDRPKYQLPMQINMPNWRSLSSQNLNLPLDNFITARQYLYSNDINNYQVQIDAIYLNKVSSFLNITRAINIQYIESTLQLKYAENIGHYALFADQNKAYLATCINSTGQATLTESQFNSNQNRYDVMLPRLGFYLLGITDLRDYRCLFTVISTPILKSDNTPAINYQYLEASWIDWHRFWQGKFPENYSALL